MSTVLNLDRDDIVKINVGGIIYESPFGIFSNLPDSRLGRIHSAVSMDQVEMLCDGYNGKEKEFFFDHTCSYFRGILGCYYAEKLHLEEATCVFDFKQVLSYWGLSESKMDSYCRHRYSEKTFLAVRDIDNHNKVLHKCDEEYFGFCDWEELRHRLWSIMERPFYTKKGQGYQIVMLVLTAMSLYTLLQPGLPAENFNSISFIIVDVIALFVFSSDYAIRFCLAGNKWRFFQSVLNFFDLLSIVPYLSVVTLTRLTFHYERINQMLRSQQIYFTIRLFRILRIARFSTSLQCIMQTLQRSSNQLATMLLLCIIAIFFFAGVLYYVERDVSDTPFNCIPQSMWWSVVTITGVGYGDYTPVTLGGRVIGVLCIFFSIVCVGVLICVVTQSFAETQNDELLKNIAQEETIAYNLSIKHNRFNCTMLRCSVEFCLQLIQDHFLLNEMEPQENEDLLFLWRDGINEDDDSFLPPPSPTMKRPSELPHSLPQRVTLNVGGAKFEILSRSMKYAPQSRLALIYEATSPRQLLKYCDGYNKDGAEIIFYHSPKFFDSIMKFYQTGKLHLTHFCLVGFREELDYWGIEEANLEPCCRMKYFFHKYEMEQCLQQKSMMRDQIARQNRLWGRKRYMLWAILESPGYHWTGRVYAILYTMVAFLDTTAIIMNSIALFHESHPIETGHPILTGIEHACINLFIADIIIRYSAAPSSYNFFSSKLNILELTSIFPSLILMVMQQIFIPVKGLPSSKFITVLHALRVSRIFKICRYSSSLRRLSHTLFCGGRDVFVLFTILFIITIVFSISICYAEEVQYPYKGMTFPDAMWWAIVTMTTVGYGDVVPISAVGKLIGAICLLASLVLISVPVSLIIVNFTSNYILTNQKSKIIKLLIGQEDFERRLSHRSRTMSNHVFQHRMMSIGYRNSEVQRTVSENWRTSTPNIKLHKARKGNTGSITSASNGTEKLQYYSKSYDSSDQEDEAK